MRTIDAIDLYSDEGSSDKVYHLTLAEDDGTYIVAYANGARGRRLTTGEKYRGTSVSAAQAKFNKVRDEKMRGSSHYRSTGTNGVPGYPPLGSSTTSSAPAAPSKAPPLVLCPVAACLASPSAGEPDTAAETYLEDPDWVLQEKHDGDRLRTLRVVGASHYQGYNRKGNEIVVGPAVQEALQLLSVPERILLDGEFVENRFFVFDCILLDEKDQQVPETFEERRERLGELLGVRDLDFAIQIVRTFDGAGAKRRMYEKIKTSGGEGVVFKRKGSDYLEGRSGDWVKVKFVERATCLVIGHNDVSSVQMGLLDASGDVVKVGNVTIPAGRVKPAVDSLIEVQYLYAYEGGSLYQPVLIGPRSDINREECTLAQLKYKVVAAAA